MGEDRKQELEGALLLGDMDDEDEGSAGGETRGTPGDGKAEEAMEFLSGVLLRMGLATRVTVRATSTETIASRVASHNVSSRAMKAPYTPPSANDQPPMVSQLPLSNLPTPASVPTQIVPARSSASACTPPSGTPSATPNFETVSAQALSNPPSL